MINLEKAQWQRKGRANIPRVPAATYFFSGTTANRVDYFFGPRFGANSERSVVAGGRRIRFDWDRRYTDANYRTGNPR